MFTVGPRLSKAVAVRGPMATNSSGCQEAHMHARIQNRLLVSLVVTCEQLTDIYNVHAALGCFWVQKLPLCRLTAKIFSYSCYAPRLWPW